MSLTAKPANIAFPKWPIGCLIGMDFLRGSGRFPFINEGFTSFMLEEIKNGWSWKSANNLIYTFSESSKKISFWFIKR